MGVVYRATQVGLDRTVALKVITPAFAEDEEFRERFKRESRLAASIEHPNVIPIHEAGEADGVLFLTMRYVDGTDLRSLLDREGTLEPRRAARIVAQVADALDAAHGAGLVHRDVKPGNVLMAAGDHAYLTDFGLTKRASSESAMTKTGQLVGTVDYIAPEQVEGKRVDARTDVYALACVLYHLLTGHVPYDKPSDMARLFAHVNDPPPVLSEAVPGLPPGLDEVVARGMAKDPAERYPSAGDLGRAAVAAAEQRRIAEPEQSVARGEAAPTAAGGHVAAAPTRPGARPPARVPPRKLRIWGAVGTVVVAAGIVIAIVSGGGNPSSNSTDTSGPPPRAIHGRSPGKNERVVVTRSARVKNVVYEVSLSIKKTSGPRRETIPAYINLYVGEPAPVKFLDRIRLPFPYARDSYVANFNASANPAPNPDLTASLAFSWFLHTGDASDVTHYFELTRHGIQVD